jgi:hypothetical protein
MRRRERLGLRLLNGVVQLLRFARRRHQPSIKMAIALREA